MMFNEFWAAMEAAKEIEIAEAVEGNTPSQDALVVRNTRTRRYYRISIPTIKDMRMEELISVLKGEREPNELVTITRIVGYYSRTDNWNKSKLSELEDRRKGNYAIGDAVPAVPAIPQVAAMRAAG
jgi:hypothetical protein